MNPSDTQLESALRKAEPTLGDEGFTELVMAALPSRRVTGVRAGRWTLAGAAVAGGLLTSLLGAPLDSVVEISFADSNSTLIVGVLLIAIVAIPTLLALYSE